MCCAIVLPSVALMPIPFTNLCLTNAGLLLHISITNKHPIWATAGWEQKLLRFLADIRAAAIKRLLNLTGLRAVSWAVHLQS